MLVEILDNILEHLPAPKQLQEYTPYTPQIQQTLSACLSVSRQLRHLAAERLFQTLHVKSSINTHHLDILLRIIKPQPPSQEWMSIRPFIHKFIFTIDSPFVPLYIIPLFNTLAESSTSRITHFEFRVSPPDSIPLFNHTFEDAVLRFIKLPTLLSLDLHGRFLTRDFLLGTHIRELNISGHGVDLDLAESNDLYTECPTLDTAMVRPSEDNYPSLQGFKTDLVWPRGLPDRALDFILRDLSHLNVEINISHAFIKVESLIKQTFSTLTTLIIMYNFDGYEGELPTSWSINFGELQALETLSFNWNNSPSSIHQNAILKGCRPLAGLHSLLDTVRKPMHSLATIRWNFCYLLTSLPPGVLLNWLESDSVRWGKLDERLAFSRLFPGLRLVDLNFCPVVMFGQHDKDSDDAKLMMGSVVTVLSENRRGVFPGLTASLGENFMFRAGGVIFAPSSNNCMY